MNQKASVTIEILIVLVAMVFTSAFILVLVKSGVIVVKEDISTDPILNAEFLPLGKYGFLAVKDFKFCNFVDEDFNCLQEQTEFRPIENVYVRFVVESTAIDQQVLLSRNYRIKNPFGEVILEADNQNVYTVDLSESKDTEQIVFADFFVMGDNAPLGEYTLETIVESPLLDKKITSTQKFILVQS